MLHRPARVLVHHDLSPWNTLVDQRGPEGHDPGWRITGVIDFEWSIAGPAAGELATQLSGLGGLIEPAALLEGYTGGARLTDDILRQAAG